MIKHTIELKTNHSKHCEESLIWFKNNARVNQNGQIEVDISFIELSSYQLLYGSINIIPEINIDIKNKLIRLALTRWRTDEKLFGRPDVINALINALEKEIEIYESNINEYYVIMFLNIDYNSSQSITPLKIKGVNINFIPWSKLNKFQTDELWKEIDIRVGALDKIVNKVETKGKQIYLPKTEIFTPIMIKLKSNNPHIAYSIASERLEIFRSAMNYVPISRVFRQFGNKLSLSPLLPSPFYGIFDNKGKFLSPHYYNEGNISYRKEIIQPNDIAIGLKLINLFNISKKGELTYLATRAIKLFQNAFNYDDLGSIYLSLWQVLELVTLNEPGKGRTNVDTHISQLLNLKEGNIIKSILEQMVEQRNELVHSGEFITIAEDLIFILKGIASDSINAIYKLSKDIRTEKELKDYYRFISVNNHDLSTEEELLKVRNKVLKFIISKRK